MRDHSKIFKILGDADELANSIGLANMRSKFANLKSTLSKEPKDKQRKAALQTLGEAIEQTRTANQDLSAEEALALADEAVAFVRRSRAARKTT